MNRSPCRFRQLTLALGALVLSLLGLLANTASAQVCQGPFTATLDQHVSAGRAQKTAGNCSSCLFSICGLPSGCDTPASYRAVGSAQALGQSGAASVTLYESPAGSFSTTVCRRCDGSETACGDGVDNDCDGQVDCSDSQCSTAPSCNSEQLHYVSVQGSAFTSMDTTYYFESSASPRTQRWTARAPLQLPDGAVIRQVNCGFSNNEQPLLEGSYARTGVYALLGGGYQNDMSLAGPANGDVLYTQQIPAMPVIDNHEETVGIFLNLLFPTAPIRGEVVFYGCSLGYKL